jgi:hypothetical protein
MVRDFQGCGALSVFQNADEVQVVVLQMALRLTLVAGQKLESAL